MKQTILFLAIMLLFGCSNMMDSDRSQNYEWLDVENPTENLSELSPTDYNRVMTAMERVKISFNANGVVILETKAAKEINVSSDIYRYILQIVKESNRSDITKRPLILTRSETEEGNGGSYTTPPAYAGNNCVAVSVCKATGLKRSFVEGILMQKYGANGVPLNSLGEAISMFGSWYTMTPSKEFNSQEFGNKALMVYDTTYGSAKPYYHAVNVNKTGINYALINDFQKSNGGSECQTKIVEYEYIKCFYKLDKVHEFGSECYE